MLGDTAPFDEWADRDDPPLSVWRTVKAWIDTAGNRPWLYLSVPVEDLSNRPFDEVRSAVVPGTAVQVYYRHQYATNIVDVIAVVTD